MKIKSVDIKNFRALKDISIPFDSVTTFIGPNGSGKSTVLRALDWFFNGKPGAISEKDCSFGAIADPIEVQVTFSDLTEKDRAELGKYAPPDVSTFTAWKRRGVDGKEILSANAKSFPEFNLIRDRTSAAEKRAAYTELRRTNPDLDLPSWTSIDAANQAMTSWEAVNIARLVEAPESLQTNFFGFNSGGKMSGLFDFVLVTADLRAGEEVMDGKSSIIGRILERSIDRTAADDEIARIVEEARVKQQQVYDKQFSTQLDEICSQLNNVVATYSSGRAIKVSPVDVELKAPKTTFEVAVLDGTTYTVVERQGHGFQRTLLISALQLLAQSGAASADGTICLAIEEPELYQHPIQAYTFAKVLRSLAEDITKRIQVTYATHSPCFLEPRHFDQVRRLSRSLGENPEVMVHLATMDDVKNKLDGIVNAQTIERQLDGIIANQLSVALFSHRAFLVEGTTEAAVFYGIGDKEKIGALEALGISIVPVGGKLSIPLAHAILTEMGIPTYTLFDADAGFELRAKARGKPEAKVAEERRSHVSANRTLLKYFGLAEEDFPAEKVQGDVAILADQLESFLTNNWPSWFLARDQIEASTGVDLEKNQGAYRAATHMAEGAVPEMLTQILSMVKGH